MLAGHRKASCRQCHWSRKRNKVVFASKNRFVIPETTLTSAPPWWRWRTIKQKNTYIYICVWGVLYCIVLYYIIYIYIHIYDSASGFCIFHISAENDSVSVQYFFSRCSQIPDHSRRKFPCPTLLLRGKMFTHGSTTVGPWWLLQRPWLYGQSP